MNAEWISLLVTAYQDTIASTEVDIFGEGTPTDASLADIIGYAHELGLKVMLKPHIDILKEDRWRGEIGPSFDEAGWSAWFDAYRSFILHYAALARDAGADLFSVGCELDATVRRVPEWRSVIAAVREVYPGPLIYADDQAESDPTAVSWWDALDYIGMDAYPTLSYEPRPSISSLCYGWEGYLEKLRVSFGAMGEAPRHHGDRLPQRRGRGPEPLGLAEAGPRGPCHPEEVLRGGPADGRGPDLARGHVLVAVDARPERRRSGRHRLLSPRQARRGLPGVRVPEAPYERSGHMQAIGLTFVDWLIIAIYFGFVLGIGFYLSASRRPRRTSSWPAARTAPGWRASPSSRRTSARSSCSG